MRRIDGSDNDPFFIKEELFDKYISARDSDLCPCGSGKTFRTCHKLRKRDSKTRLDQIDRILLRRAKKRQCYAEGLTTCSDMQTFSHSIPRSSLESIAEQGHILQLRMPGIKAAKDIMSLIDIEPELIGINEACCFYGYCSKHDNTLFAPIEKQEVLPTAEQSTLFYFRALCREINAKTETRSFFRLAKKLAEERNDAESAHAINLQNIQHQIGSERAVAELLRYHGRTISDIQNNSFSRLKSLVLRTNRALVFNCCMLLNPSYDLEGRIIQDIDDIDTDTEYFSMNCINDSKGGLIHFAWPADSILDGYFLPLARYGERLLDFLLQFVLAYSENHGFNQSWWQSLSELQKRRLKTIFFHNIEDMQTGENPIELFRYLHFQPPMQVVFPDVQ